MVEQLPVKELVPGSSPGAGAWLATNRLRAIFALQAPGEEVWDTSVQDSKSF